MEAHNNPYVGPRTFTREDAHLYFGREREARDLRDRVISERLVLFYAQSGAGKSSLLNTRLIPQLVAEEFTVLPVGRISGASPIEGNHVDNIFSFNLMLSLARTQSNFEHFYSMNLSHFFAHLVSDDGEHWYYDEIAGIEKNQRKPSLSVPAVLIIDQFEEIITHHSERWPERVRFFQQLNQAMLDDPNLWVVLTLREDYVAALDPYALLMENRLRARFYMQRMDVEAALEAIQKPATAFGRPFEPCVAEKLVDNLRRVQLIGKPSDVQGTVGESEYSGALGEFIEPVQLQVVCYQLWENLRQRQLAPINEQNLQESGDIDQALTNFYEQTIATVLANTAERISERTLRNWFSQRLITEAETRGLVYQGSTDTSEIPNTIVEELKQRFLVRAEIRGGGTWIELVHDRFVGPILKANHDWNKNENNSGSAYFTTTSLDSLSGIDKQIAKIVSGLRPFQALEYDPTNQSSLLITEWLVSYADRVRIPDLVSRRKPDEKLTIRCYEENYKIALIKQLQNNDAVLPNKPKFLDERIIEMFYNLKPYQVLEFDPLTNIIIIVTEWLIPRNDIGRIYDVIAHRKEDEKMTIRRYDENYKVALIKRIRI